MIYPSEEFDDAVAALCDGTLDEDRQTALTALLQTDLAAQDAYLFAVELHARLASDNALFLPLEAVAKEEKIIPFSARPAVRRWMAIAALLAGVAIVTALFLHGAKVGHTEPFARLVRSAGAEFADTVVPAEGQPLSGGGHTLTKGSVEIVTAQGATVVLEAPAEFAFESAQRLRLARGKAAAEVPPAAKGFTIVTPTGEIVDLGTKFGVDVAGGGASEVHVFKGEVIARAGQSAPQQSLRQDQALALNGGSSNAREMRSAAFIHADELQQLAAGLKAGRQAHWAAALRTLRHDPALLGWLDLGALPAGEYRRAQGRWPGTQAVEFTQPGDYLPVEFSGVTEELTLAVWVRLDQVPHALNSLLHTNDWEQPGQVHWMVTEKQRMRFAVFDMRCVDQSNNRYPESSRQVTAATGRWTHLAVVYHAPHRTVRFYLDGDFDNEVALLGGVPAVLGPGRVGNWNRQERILSGRLDELVLLRRALSDEEIRTLYEAGKPYANQ